MAARTAAAAARTGEGAEARTAAVGARNAEAYAAADDPTSPAGVLAGSTAVGAPGSTAVAVGPAGEEEAEPRRPAAAARAARSLAAGMTAASRRVPGSGGGGWGCETLKTSERGKKRGGFGV